MIEGNSYRKDCDSESQAQELAEQVKEEFKQKGVVMIFDAWAIGKAVHFFPVYFRCRGSLADLERFEKKDLGRYGHGR